MFALPLIASALAWPVHTVPPGAEQLTVHVCERQDGCPEEWTVLSAEYAAPGRPLMALGDLVTASLAGEEALRAWERAPGLDTLDALPFTVDRETLFALHLERGEAGEQEAWRDAAAISGGRVHDLPELSEAGLASYLDVATATTGPAWLEVHADHPSAHVFLDGLDLGPPPMRVSVWPGWHRVSVERPGRRTAWVHTRVLAVDEVVRLDARVAADDSPASVGAALAAGLRGAPVPKELTEPLTAWARGHGLVSMELVLLLPRDAGPGAEQRLEDPDPDAPLWDLHRRWLDVATGELVDRAPVQAGSARRRLVPHLGLGAGLGYARLGEHDHVVVELAGVIGLLPWLAIDLRAGVARAGQPYYFGPGATSRLVLPLAAGVRVSGPGPYAVVSGLAVAPTALGGELRAGWELAPAAHWLIWPEARGGWTGKGAWLGAGVTVTRSR